MRLDTCDRNPNSMLRALGPAPHALRRANVQITNMINGGVRAHDHL
jgi:hypothetical protein